MRTTIIKLEVILDIHEIFGANNSDIAPELMKQLHKSVDAAVISCGFERLNYLSDKPSRRNEGWAYYDSYSIQTSTETIKVVINVRTANHRSKPDLATKNNKRLEVLKKASNDAQLAVIDTYYEERDWGTQYYIGKGDKYSEPVDSLDALLNILKAQLKKLLSKYSIEVE